MRAVLVFTLGLAALVGTACPDPAARSDRARRRLADEGARARSPAQRTADERPKPWADERRPHDADRMDLASARAEQRARGAVADDVSLAECLRLQEAYPCPLLTHRWAARDVPGGIAVRVGATKDQAARLRDFIRCHEAHGRHDSAEQTCVGQLGRVRVSGGHRDGEMTMTLTADRPELEGLLRKRVRALIVEAR
jgi:hypothetical protein